MAMLVARFGRPAAAGRTWCIGSRLRCDDSFGGRAHISIIAGTYRQGCGQPQAHQLVELCSRGPTRAGKSSKCATPAGAWGTVQGADANELLSGDSGPGAGCLGTRGLGDPMIDVCGETGLFPGSLVGSSLIRTVWQSAFLCC